MSLNKISDFDCKQGAVRAVRYNVDGEYCLTCGSDKSIKLWRPSKALHLQTFNGHGYDVLDARGSCDSSQIASASMDKCVLLWDVTTAQVLRRYRAHHSHVNCVQFNEQSTLILSASVDGTVKIWDCKSRSKEAVQVLDEAKDSVTSIAVSDHEILTASLDQRVRRYDMRKGLMHCDHCKHSINSVCFTKDGQCVLISCLNSVIKLLDKDSGECLAEYKGHVNNKYKIDSCLTSNDTIILSGSEDGFVYCWDLIETSLRTRLQHINHRVVHSLSSHPNKNNLLTAAEGSVYLWSDQLNNE